MSFIKKWYTYQKERFPIVVYGIYIGGIVFAIFCFSNYIKTMNLHFYKIEWSTMILMFIVAFLQFLMVRIIDEFKDYEEDCKFRPYRPVPRGLIKLNELKILFIICVILQFTLTLKFNKNGILYLIILWIYFAIMSKDFFIKKVIDKHILIGVFLDELLMPILVIYLSSFMDISYTEIKMLLLMSYFISWIVEIARKIRCKEEEEKGVKTYTAILGIKKATLLLWLLEAIVMMVNKIILQKESYIIVGFMVVSIVDLLFMIKKSKVTANLIQLSANIYIMLAYLNMGVFMIN